MNLFPRPPWVNLLALLPGTTLTLLTIAVAFLRFYNEKDWLILALSGTLEIERQIAWLKKSDEEARQRHELRKENEWMAVLESKIDGLFSKYNINLTPGSKPEQP